MTSKQYILTYINKLWANYDEQKKLFSFLASKKKKINNFNSITAIKRKKLASVPKFWLIIVFMAVFAILQNVNICKLILINCLSELSYGINLKCVQVEHVRKFLVAFTTVFACKFHRLVFVQATYL